MFDTPSAKYVAATICHSMPPSPSNGVSNIGDSVLNQHQRVVYQNIPSLRRSIEVKKPLDFCKSIFQ